ncbi:MAG: [FeFe] hydrogenase H-cluster maturation GTPase HydF, partial [Syntrophomonadaceae bacterium]|nr:[FeFe] hydrogenase H-cluster maturation GTPase HydF [Syntrophomonadaceae bacterium]
LLSSTADDLNYEQTLIKTLESRQIPFITVLNKIDLPQGHPKTYYEETLKVKVHEISCLTQQGINELIKIIIDQIPKDYEKSTIVGDLLKPGDICVLVTPIDNSAPKGRLILPQVQTIRDILDNNAVAIVTKEKELSTTLDNLSGPPNLVITDAQVFAQVARILPSHIPLTAFSIVYARYKGDLEVMLNGIKAIEELKNGDKVLIAEACTHHTQKDDIGTVKIPNIFKKLGKEVEFAWCKGSSYPENLDEYKLIIHCGACMLNRQQMMNRIRKAERANVPITNYGVFLAYANGILNRAVEPFNLNKSNNT